MILVSDTPAQHPRIQDTERRYIETTIGANKKEDTNVRDAFIIVEPLHAGMHGENVTDKSSSIFYYIFTLIQLEKQKYCIGIEEFT